MSDDWDAVWTRARVKAAGIRTTMAMAPTKLRVAEPKEPKPPTEAELLAEEGTRAVVERFLERGKPIRLTTPPMPAAVSAVQVRLGWYIPPRHRGDTLDTYVPQNASQEAALSATADWVAAVKAGEGGALALLGDVGTGKSHLLYAAVRAINEANLHAAAYGWYDLANMLREAKYNAAPEVQTEATQKRDRLFAAKAFGIDEIRPTSNTEFDVTELAQLMTRAYAQCQGVIVTSNAADRQLTEIIGRAASSRLTQVKIVGLDLRKPENHRTIRAV